MNSVLVYWWGVGNGIVVGCAIAAALLYWRSTRQ